MCMTRWKNQPMIRDFIKKEVQFCFASESPCILEVDQYSDVEKKENCFAKDSLSLSLEPLSCSISREVHLSE